MKISTPTLSAAVILTATISLYPKTVYVDKAYGPNGIGSKPAPYESINKALSDFNADEIIVMPGIYPEKLDIKKNITIRAYDGPHTTLLNGAGLSADAILVTLDPWLDVTLEGLKISGANIGIYQPTGGRLLLRNCVICNATQSGVWLAKDETSANVPELLVFNCILFANGGNGLTIKQIYSGLPPRVTAYNNIFVGNGGYGVALSWDGAGGSVSLGSRIFLDYNVAATNTLGNYSEPFAPGKSISVGAHSFEAEPEFVGGSGPLSTKDFRLAPSSPCRDLGNPAAGFVDADGTRNDIGAYGGPGALTFYTNPNDGPIVREVTIDKGLVPKGETFTIRAKGAVR